MFPYDFGSDQTNERRTGYFVSRSFVRTLLLALSRSATYIVHTTNKKEIKNEGREQGRSCCLSRLDTTGDRDAHLIFFRSRSSSSVHLSLSRARARALSAWLFPDRGGDATSERDTKIRRCGSGSSSVVYTPFIMHLTLY